MSPFITQERRRALERDPRDIETYSDMCYLFYKDMVKKWKADPRWGTAHKIYKDIRSEENYLTGDDMIARELAWQMFFQWHVVPYEQEKEEMNGSIK